MRSLFASSLLPQTVHVYLLVFGLLTIAGGTMGYVKAKSRPSLIAGAIAGGLLVLAWYLVGTQGRVGMLLGLVVSLVLAGRFVSAYLKSRKVMPAGIMAVLSVIGVVLTVLALSA